MDSTARFLPPGVVVLERGWLSSNNVVIVGADSASLVDSGYGSHSEQTASLVSRVLLGRPLTRLVNTHLHSDHCGGNAALQREFPGLETLIPPGLAAAVRAWDEDSLTYAPTGQNCPRFTFDATVQPGGTVMLGDLEWEVHAAPGHDPHSVVLFEPGSRTLISADALWENGFGVVFPELDGNDAFDEVATTLDLIEGLRPRAVIPGHGRVFVGVEEALARARSRLAAFVASPSKHGNHAAKVLLKFKLLELQRTDLDRFLDWSENARYLQLVHERYQRNTSLRAWVEKLLNELVASGAARRDGNALLDA